MWKDSPIDGVVRIGEECLVMLETVVPQAVAECQQPDVLAVVPRSEQRSPLRHQFAQAGDQSVPHGEIVSRIGRDTYPAGAGTLGERHSTEILARQQRRINQRREGHDR